MKKDSAAHERRESAMTEAMEERMPDDRSSPRVPQEERDAYGGHVPQEVKDCYKR